MKAYKVSEGEVTELHGNEVNNFNATCDWKNEVLAMCDTPEEALILANKYDEGEIDSDNVIIENGKVLVAITSQCV